jgi:hypothetical protein
MLLNGDEPVGVKNVITTVKREVALTGYPR